MSCSKHFVSHTVLVAWGVVRLVRRGHTICKGSSQVGLDSRHGGRQVGVFRGVSVNVEHATVGAAFECDDVIDSERTSA